jgi:hypothetical protein
MRPVRLICVLALVALTTGCGDENPTRPSGSGTAVTGLAITGPDAVLTGLSTSYTLTATSADGSTRTVTPAWTSSNPAVASVDAAGRLGGRSHGSTTLMATYEGRSVSKPVQVVNNYGGTWVGKYVIRACTDTGDLTNHDGGWCLAGPGRVGTVEGILLKLAQSGNNLSDVTGTIGSFRETVTGTVSPDGRLSLSGTLIVRDFYYDDITLETVQLDSWDTILDGSDGMTGRWSEDLTFLTWRIGTAHTENEFVAMTRLSSITPPASANR